MNLYPNIIQEPITISMIFILLTSFLIVHNFFIFFKIMSYIINQIKFRYIVVDYSKFVKGNAL